MPLCAGVRFSRVLCQRELTAVLESSSAHLRSRSIRTPVHGRSGVENASMRDKISRYTSHMTLETIAPLPPAHHEGMARRRTQQRSHMSAKSRPPIGLVHLRMPPYVRARRHTNKHGKGPAHSIPWCSIICAAPEKAIPTQPCRRRQFFAPQVRKRR